MISSMADMDEYNDQLLAEIQMPEPAQKVVRNILDEPIPETVKKRLLKPLFPKKYRTPRPPPTWKDRESKATLEQFDPLPPQKGIRTVQDYQQEILELFEEEQRHELVFYRTPWVIGSLLRGWQMDIPKGHPSGVGVRAFMQEVEPRIHDKLEEEILALNGYVREDTLESHRPEGRGIGQTAVRVEMPEKGKNKLTFQNHYKQLPAPYIIYADFEALITKVEGPELDPTESNTKRTQQ